MNMKKTLLASAVSLALVGTAHANIEQLKKANGASLHEIIGTSGQLTLVEDKTIASSWLVVLNAPAASDAMMGGTFDLQRAQSNVETAEILQQKISDQILLSDPDAQIHFSTKNLVAGLVVSASSESLAALKRDPNVLQVLPIYDSELHVAASQEYIRAVQTVQSGKATGEGVRVAVLDTGIDYTHAIFGGEGTPEAYAAASAAGNQSIAPAWPIGQVVGGFDFINNDPNPIDPITAGHGTSVAHSVSGIAPNVSLYAYTVCTGGCPGAAQLRALEASMDPNGDGNLEDRVDIINMSLGGQFGSTQSLSGTQFLIQRAATLGTNVVISAGNDGNVPFRIAGPSTTPNALSVGAMTHPEAAVGVFESSVIDGESVAMVAAGFNQSFDFAFDSTTTPLVVIPGPYTACDPLAEDVDLTGKAVLLSRGVCAFTQKVKVAQERGAAFVIIANSNPGEAPFVAGGSDPEVNTPTIMISKEVGDAIKAKLDAGDVVNFNIRSESKSGAGAIANFTSRGPSMDGLLKPEITAPGVAIDVARVGTSTGTRPVNGTSFSGPITAGAVALLRGALPERNAQEIKATLMNTANLTVHREPIEINPDAQLASISQIGAGLVDVEKAVNSPVAAWVTYPEYGNTQQAALSFGLQMLDQTSSMTKRVTLKNFSDEAKTYTLRIEDRYEDKTETGALTWNMPETVTVPAKQTVHFDVTLTVDPSKLPEFVLANGLFGQPLVTPMLLDQVEFDGALVFNDTATESDHDLHLVYHVIPRAEAKLALDSEMVNGKVVNRVTNTGVIPVEPFASTLVATSPVNPAINGKHDIAAVTFDIGAFEGCRSGVALYPTLHLQEGINHLMQGNYAVDLDINNDQVWDYTVNTLLLTRFGPNFAAFPGVMVSFTTPYGTLSGNFGDVLHFSGGKQVTLEACLDTVGLTIDDLGSNITMRARTSSDSFSLFDNFIADSVVSSVQLSESPAVSLVKSLPLDSDQKKPAALEESNEVEALQPGERAYLLRPEGDNRNFVLLSSQAEAAAVADYSAEFEQPVVNSELTFTVNENAASGTVIGQLSAATDFRTVVSEYLVLASSSNAIMIDASGKISVADSSALDYEGGMTKATFAVAALDTAGGVSEPVMVEISINNIPDELPVVTASLTQTTMPSGTPAGTAIGDFVVEIMEADATLEPITTSNTLFAVENNKIVLTRKLVRNDKGSHTFSISAADSAGLSVTNNFTFAVTHVDVPPVVSASFSMTSIPSGTAAGTVVGTVNVNIREEDASLVSVTSNNPLFAVQNGQIVLTRSPGKSDADVQRVTFIATDSVGLEGRVTTSTVVTHKSGGGAGWLGLLLLPLAMLRRRSKMR